MKNINNAFIYSIYKIYKTNWRLQIFKYFSKPTFDAPFIISTWHEANLSVRSCQTPANPLLWNCLSGWRLVCLPNTLIKTLSSGTQNADECSDQADHTYINPNRLQLTAVHQSSQTSVAQSLVSATHRCLLQLLNTFEMSSQMHWQSRKPRHTDWQTSGLQL